MIIYGSSVSPFVRKAMAFAAEKGIEVTPKGVNLGSDNPEFLKASPFKKMPALSDGDYHLADSSAIVNYLEALKPEPNLIPTDAKGRGKAIWFDEYADTILMGVAGKIFFNRVVAPRFLGQDGDAEAADRAEHHDLPPVLAYLESVIPASGHLVEDRLTLADIAVAAFFPNLDYAGVKIDAAAYPKVAAFGEAMLARPSFAGSLAHDRKLLGG